MIHPHRGPHLIRYGIRVITPPTDEQFDAAEAREHLRITQTDEDNWFTNFIPVAREYCEYYLARSLAPQTLEFTANTFPNAPYFRHPAANEFDVQRNSGIVLPMGPITEIESVKYYDVSTTLQTIDSTNYFLDDGAEPAVLYPVSGYDWPSTWHIMSAVRIRFKAGYDLPDAATPTNPLPASLKAAMLMVLGHLHENREATSDTKIDEIALGAKSFMDHYCLRKRFA